MRVRRRNGPVKPRRVRLTGRASRYLTMLVDFGHLDDVAYDDVLVALADAYGAPDREAVVDVAEVRPIAATILAALNPDAQEGTGPLAEDWGPLFF